jgi:hypothetical protein
MAKEYRSWLLAKFPGLGRKAAGAGGVPIAVEIVGAVSKIQHRLGIPLNLPLKLTSYKEAEGMIDSFAKRGWKNVHIKLKGWFNGGVDHAVPSKIKLIKRLGNKNDFRGLVAAAGQNSYELYPEADFVYMRNVKPADGFSLYRDASRYINRKRVERYPFSFVWFGERNRWGNLSYLARPSFTTKTIGNFTDKAAGLEMQNVAFRNMGAKLGGDYHEDRIVSREAAMRIRQDTLAALDGAGVGMMIESGFVYTAPWASFITDMPFDDQGFGITDVAVPFYQIALHGLVPFTGRAINLAEDYTKNLLKTIEGGGGLYFSFMHEETAVLQETKFRQFYANVFNKWIEDADALYRKFSADFSGLYSQEITGHSFLSAGVTETVYANGARVIVNHNDFSFRHQRPGFQSLLIGPNNYVVLRQGE